MGDESDAPQPVGVRLGLPCLTCGQRIRYFLGEPYSMGLDHTGWSPKSTGLVTYTAEADAELLNKMIPSECESCRLSRATDAREREDLNVDLAELESVAERTGLAGTPFTMQKDRWLLRSDRADLAGFSVTSYGIWFLPTGDIARLDIRFIHVQRSNEPPLLKLYPLEIISHPDISAELHIRWNPMTGEKWVKIVHERSASIKDLKRLMGSLAMYRLARPPGRRDGRTRDRADILNAYTRFYHANGWHPDQSEVAAELCVTSRTITNTLEGESWAEFSASSRRALRSRTVRVTNR